MQDKDISSIEFHKLLPEVEYPKLKADIRNQDKERYNRSRKNNEKNYLNKEEKKTGKILYEKSKILIQGIHGVSAIWNMKLLHLTACDFKVYKDHKINL